MKVVNPPNALWSLLASRHWDAAVTMLEGSSEIRGHATKKLSLSPNDSVSVYPLHFALLESGSENLVLALLDAFKPAAKHHYNHDLPLHLAIKQTRSLNIISALYDAYPDSFEQTCNGMKLLNMCSKFKSHPSVVTFIRCKLETNSNSGRTLSSSLGQASATDVGLALSALKEIKDTQDQILGALAKLSGTQDAILQSQAVVLSKLSEVTRYIDEGKIDREDDKQSMQADLKSLRTEVEADIAALDRKIKELQTQGPDANIVIPEIALTSHQAESFVQIGSVLWYCVWKKIRTEPKSKRPRCKIDSKANINKRVRFYWAADFIVQSVHQRWLSTSYEILIESSPVFCAY